MRSAAPAVSVYGAVLHTGVTYVLFYFVLIDIGAIYFGPSCLAPCLGQVAGRAAGGRPPSVKSLRPGTGAARAQRVGMGAAGRHGRGAIHIHVFFLFLSLCFSKYM